MGSTLFCMLAIICTMFCLCEMTREFVMMKSNEPKAEHCITVFTPHLPSFFTSFFLSFNPHRYNSETHTIGELSREA